MQKMHEEIIKALRICTSERTLSRCSKLCSYRNIPDCRTHLMRHAAEAIEKLRAENNELLFRCGQAEALIDYYQTGKLLSNELPEEET